MRYVAQWFAARPARVGKLVLIVVAVLLAATSTGALFVVLVGSLFLVAGWARRRSALPPPPEPAEPPAPRRPDGIDPEVLVRFLERLVEAGATPEAEDPPREPPRHIEARRD